MIFARRWSALQAQVFPAIKEEEDPTMLSPAMLKMSMTRRTSLRETRHPEIVMPSRPSMTIIFDEDEDTSHRPSRKGSSTSDDSTTAIIKLSNASGGEETLLLRSVLDGLQLEPSGSGRGGRRTSITLMNQKEDKRRRDSGARQGVSEIQPHQYTEDPTVAWEMLKTKRPVKLVRQMKPDTPIKPDNVRFVCVSCTHGLPLDPATIPPGDVLIVAGDFTSCGLPKEVKAFNANLAQLKHTYKVVIAGNHECTFDDNFLRASSQSPLNLRISLIDRDIGEAKELALKQALLASLAAAKLANPRPLLANAIYLQDTVIELFGITIYGTPWQPRIDNWAFNLPRGQPLLDKWNQIPAGVDVLITHTPPLGHGDTIISGHRMGCVELLNSVTKRIKPKYHVFGHIHEGYGCTSDGYTKFINCCLTNQNLEKVNEPVIFDIPVHPTTKNYYTQNVKKITKRLVKGK